MLRVSFRRLCEAAAAPVKLQVAIIGSGPSGCYTADHLLKKCGPNIHIDVYDRMPVPFGLVRYGVAPDHPEVKNVEDRFLRMFTEESSRVTWLGNVDIGRTLTINQLRQSYHAVVLATGADSNNKLHIPGEELANIFSARQFVNFYNTLPAPYCNSLASPFKMNTVRKAVIIGNGNVALDIARVLSAPYQHWCPTDMNGRAIRDLLSSTVEEIDIIARRGEEHAAFATAEFRELATTFSNDEVEVRLRDFDLDAALKRSDGSRARKRMLELMHKYTDSNLPQRRAEFEAKAKASREAAERAGAAEYKAVEAMKDSDNVEERYRYWKQNRATLNQLEGVIDGAKEISIVRPRRKRIVNFCFGMRPVAFLPRPDQRNFVGGVELEVSSPDGGPPTRVVCPADVVFTSVGYRSDPIHGAPYDEARGLIPNSSGRVLAEAAAGAAVVPQLYVAGWAKRGPRGAILHAMMDAQETAAKVLEDVGASVLKKAPPPPADEAVPACNNSSDAAGPPSLPLKKGKFDLFDYLVSKEIIPLTIKGAQRIFEAERAMGADLGKRLEKMNSVRHMVDVGVGGTSGYAAAREFRGLVGRPKQAELLSAFLDDDTDMRPIAKSFGKRMPLVLESSEFLDPRETSASSAGKGGMM